LTAGPDSSADANVPAGTGMGMGQQGRLAADVGHNIQLAMSAVAVRMSATAAELPSRPAGECLQLLEEIRACAAALGELRACVA